MRYTAWGEVRYNSGSEMTNYTYTGQYSYTQDFGPIYYNARWYDPSLGRFAQADSIIPEQSQGVQAWDRYAYANNNPILHNDPSGHCIWDLCIVEIGLVSIGIVELTALAAGTCAALYVYAPGGDERVDSLVTSITIIGEGAADSIIAATAKGEYIPSGLSDAERKAYRDAIHRYKKIWGLGAADDVPKDIIDDIAEAIKNGAKPNDAAEGVDSPPEEDITIEEHDIHIRFRPTNLHME